MSKLVDSKNKKRNSDKVRNNFPICMAEKVLSIKIFITQHDLLKVDNSDHC